MPLNHSHTLTHTITHTIEQPDEARALLHYYFGAGGGDALSRLALGYRHTHGAGVPKSCWAAAAYYQPVAEAVVEQALAAGGVPHVRSGFFRLQLQLQLAFADSTFMQLLFGTSTPNGLLSCHPAYQFKQGR